MIDTRSVIDSWPQLLIRARLDNHDCWKLTLSLKLRRPTEYKWSWPTLNGATTIEWSCCSEMIKKKNILFTWLKFLWMWYRGIWGHASDPQWQPNRGIQMKKDSRYLKIFISVALLCAVTCPELWWMVLGWTVLVATGFTFTVRILSSFQMVCFISFLSVTEGVYYSK